MPDLLHHAMHRPLTHTLLKWSAVMAAFATAALAFVHYMLRRDIVTLIIGFALLCADSIDAFHTLAADRLIEAAAPNADLIPFSWAVSRVFNAFILLVGGVLALRWSNKAPGGGYWTIAAAVVLFGVLAYLLIQMMAASGNLPQTTFPDSIVTRPWDIAPLGLYAAAAIFVYPALHRREGSAFTLALLLAFVPSIATQANMAFGSTALFDSAFNVAHFLKIVAYVIPMAGLMVAYVQTYRSAEQRGAALSASESRLRAVVDTAADAIIVMDERGGVESFNPAAERMFSLHRDDAIGVNISTLMPAAIEREHDSYLHSYATTGRTSVEWNRRELTGKRRDGSEFPMELSVAEIADGDDRKFTGLIRDITERKEAEERQRGLLIAAESAAAAKAQFLATMSHEIRTPMYGVIGMAALLSSTERDSQQEQYLGAITRSADALLRVIDDVLDFPKIDAGKMTIESRPFDMRETIEDVAILMAAKAREEGIPLYLEISPDLPELLFGDEGRIRQVAINFLGNALKFTHHGRITVKVSAEGEGDMRIVTFSVRDTGIGMAKDKQEAVFEAFTQADGSSTRDYGGTGLGLSICRRLVELMNGSIGVNSELSVRSEFWALLPLRVADSANGTHFGATAVAGSKVLIVDPDEESAAAMLEQLTHWDCEVSVTQSVPLDVSEYGTVIADAAAVSEHWPEDAQQSGSTTNFVRIAGLHSAEELRRGSRVLFRPIRRSALLEAVLNAGPAPLRERTFIESSDASFLGLRVLLAEDDAINQEVTRAMLEGWGCEVTLVETGAGAVEVIASGASIDVVLMDCQMPVMDGLEATRRIRAGERKHDRAATPIVAMTANAMPEDRQRCLEAGMDEYLGKPVKPNALFSMLTAASGVKRQLATPARPPSFERPHAIDQDALRQACLGNEALVTKMVAKFIEAAQQTVQEIEAAISSNSTDEVKRLVHKLKGSSATVYAEALQSALADMEVAIMEGARDEALEKFTEIREELAWLKATVEPAA